jgi:hypothetical protein
VLHTLTVKEDLVVLMELITAHPSQVEHTAAAVHLVDHPPALKALSMAMDAKAVMGLFASSGAMDALTHQLEPETCDVD